ncbi:MAG: DNA-binding response regulator [Planctomycetota bacterium]|nr:MAG: DNA-binding response regulator [Planctomycetota bacterium]
MNEAEQLCRRVDELETTIQQLKARNEQLQHQIVDLALVDLSLKESSGLDLIHRIKSRCPQVQILVVSTYDESLFAERVLSAGAMGYINKQEATDQLIDAIHTVLNGRVFLSSQMTDCMLQRAAGNLNSLGQSPEQILSDREFEVFELIGRGLAIREVAARLHLSSKTVERYRENIKEKLHVKSATDLVRRATQWVLENT